MTGVSARTTTMFRLYGIAILALLIGYGFAIPAAQSGDFPWGVTAMGTLSNGGPAILLTLQGAASRQPFLTTFFYAIAICLIASMIFPDAALSKLF